MAVVNPIAYLHNAGAVHTAEVIRSQVALMGAGRHSLGGLKPIPGVHREMGGGYQVVENGVPNMSVNVSGGIALVPGTEGITQGSYVCVNSATENLAIAAAHATLARIDRVGIRVRDAAYSGVNNDGANVVITGTPSGSPSAPAEPSNFLTLALVSIPAADTAITNSQITDMRIGLCAPGGVIHCTSGNKPVTGQISDGQEIFEVNTGLYKRYNTSTATWTMSRPWTTQVTLGSAAAILEVTGIPSSLRKLKIEYFIRCASAVQADNLLMRINNVSGNHIYTHMTQTNVTNGPLANDQGANHFAIGIATGASAPAGFFGSGVINVGNWNYANNFFPRFHWQTGAYATTATNAYNAYGQGIFNSAGPYTNFRFLMLGGSNIVAGSWCTVEGWE